MLKINTAGEKFIIISNLSPSIIDFYTEQCFYCTIIADNSSYINRDLSGPPLARKADV